MSTMSTARPRSVTFSPICDVAYVAKEDNPSKKWYSSKDKKYFRRALLRDGKQLSVMVEDLPAEAVLTPDQLLECLGIEIFVTRGLAEHVMQMRHAHIATVLSEHARQEHQGVCNVKRLSSVSKVTSRFLKERAKKLATGYSKILDE